MKANGIKEIKTHTTTLELNIKNSQQKNIDYFDEPISEDCAYF